MAGEGRLTVKMQCPSLSEESIISFWVAWEEERVDLGSIARTFGLDPSTLKLNGHFISRGVDLIASSVTWKSLLSYFSARRLPTGTSDSDALVVDGKLSKVRTKNTPDFENRIACTSEDANCSINERTQVEDSNLRKKKRFRDGNSAGSDHHADQITKCNSFSLKRKQQLEDFTPPKRIKSTIGTKLGFQGGENGCSGTISSTQFPCSFISENMKRMRGGNGVPAPSKRTR